MTVLGFVTLGILLPALIACVILVLAELTYGGNK